ncbi:MAG: 50S ribosomal protein L11 methyltransferase, partial [Hyphomicrobiaceae bacterium]
MTAQTVDETVPRTNQIRLSLLLDDRSAALQIADDLQWNEICPATALSVFEDNGGTRWRIDAYYLAPPVPSVVMEVIAGHTLVQPPELAEVPDENWVAISQAALPPVASGRFIVHGSHDRARVGRRQWAIEIEAGEAFGTAHHATTDGCLQWLDHLGRNHRPGRILDLGCGTGVLAIAASRLWPRAQVTASDIDETAVSVARANACLNRAGNRIRMVAAAGVEQAMLRHRGPYDLIVANILAGPLIRLAPSLARSVRPGGYIVLAGILTPQAR